MRTLKKIHKMASISYLQAIVTCRLRNVCKVLFNFLSLAPFSMTYTHIHKKLDGRGQLKCNSLWGKLV